MAWTRELAGIPSVTAHSADREAAFAALFEEYSTPIYNYALRMVGDPTAPPTSRRTRSSRPIASSTS